MKIDKNRYKVLNWKNPLILHYIINPGAGVLEIGGYVIPKVTLIDKQSNKPYIERNYVPCPHCNYIHNSITWSSINNTQFKNWFGLYCPNCGGIIPVIRNLTVLLILAITYPIWGWFHKSWKQAWLKKQPERFQNLELELPPKMKSNERILLAGLVFGVSMYLMMEIIFPFISKEPITQAELLKAIPVWLAAGVIWAVVMIFWMNKKGKKSV